jgi:hypothetical protein
LLLDKLGGLRGASTMGNDISDEKVPEVKVSVVDIEEALPQYSTTEKRSRLRRCASMFRRSLHRRNSSEESPWPKLIRRALYLFAIALILCAVAVMYENQLPFSPSPWLIPS